MLLAAEWRRIETPGNNLAARLAISGFRRRGCPCVDRTRESSLMARTCGRAGDCNECCNVAKDSREARSTAARHVSEINPRFHIAGRHANLSAQNQEGKKNGTTGRSSLTNAETCGETRGRKFPSRHGEEKQHVGESIRADDAKGGLRRR